MLTNKVSVCVTAVIVFVLLLGAAQATPLTQVGMDYVVQPGETLALIAERLLGDAGRFGEIVAVTNGKHETDSSYARVDDPARIEVGAKLFIPPVEGGVVGEMTGAAGEEPSGEPGSIARGKIAFSFYNLGREVYEVQIVDVESGERWIVTDEESVSEPALSPDGRRIAVRGWDRHRGIQSFDLYGGNRQVISGHHEDSRPDWGHWDAYVFASQRESDRLWRLYVNDEVLKWENRALIGEDPAWSPDEARIVYRGCDFDLNNCGLRTVERGGGQPVILTTESSDIFPDWSPDGSLILFASRRSGNWDLYTLSVDGEGRAVSGLGPERIAEDPSNELMPAWSPWGDALAFVSDRDGTWGVYIMRPDGTDIQKVAEVPGTYDPPLWTLYGGRGATDEQISWAP